LGGKPPGSGASAGDELGPGNNSNWTLRNGCCDADAEGSSGADVGRRRAACNPCDRYAPVIDAASEVHGGVLAACLVWEVVDCVEDMEESRAGDVAKRGTMRRQAQRATPWVIRRDGEHGIYVCGNQIDRM